MMKTFVKTLAGIGIAASTLLGSSAAQAQSASIRYQPHELQTIAGSQAVFDRIGRTAKRACRKESDPLRRLYTQPRCRADLTEQLVTKIGHPLVTALWRGERGVQLAGNSR